MRNRIIWLDLVKVFAIFSVVFLHSTTPILGQFGKIDMTYWHIGNAYDSMVRMAVPLFFMVTGALLLNRKEEHLSIFFRKRFLKVAIPLIAWSFIYIMFRKYALHEDLNITKLFLSSFVWKVYYHLWFLYTIIGIYLFIPILKVFVKNSSQNIQVYFLILWIFSVSILPLVDELFGLKLPNYMPMMVGYMGYLVLGQMLSKLQLSIYMLCISIILIFISTLVTIFGTFYLSKDADNFVEFFYGYFSLSTMLQSISYFIVLKYIGEKINIKNTKLISVIVTVSSVSLGIYLIHPIILWAENEIGISALNGNNPLYMVPITAILAFIMSFLIVYHIRKIPILRNIVP